ncbi:carboxylate-amine ligase [Rhodococcoides yunnanense]|uniref:carboxylate-amine ligase n=1 Tax=Rhodococcoides yunnanense TaxID=278209 RepID=UPI000934ADEF|nr:glutamate--cysteine ligase [Rhodococcus yunnanensis]
MADVPTFGVEEELLLVDPNTGVPTMQNDTVADYARELGLTLQLELTPCQIETATDVLDTSAELTDALTSSRSIAAHAAHLAGASVLPAGVPPLLPELGPITDTKRYRRIAAEYGIIALEQGVCGAHVHIAIPNRDAAVQISNHVRPWLPVLLALTANSAFYAGRDTGYASWRSVLWSRWPSAGPPPFLDSITHYDELVAQLFDVGAILDDGMVYWDIRPSMNFPTLEVRISDVPVTVHDTVLLAVLVRALVMTASEAVRNNGSAPAVPEHALRLAYWRAARDGLSDRLVDPETGRLDTAAAAVRALVHHVSDALAITEERSLVDTGVRRNLLHGNGAGRQRAAVAETGSIAAAVVSMTESVDRCG